MSPIRSSLLFSCAFALSLAAVPGCGKSEFTANPSPASGPLGTGGAVSSNTEGGNVRPSSMRLDHVLCQNPISLEEPRLTPIRERKSVPQGKFKISGIQFYMVQDSTNNSFLASATSANGFSVSLDCQGMRDVSADNFDRTYTDDSGGVHHDSSSHSSHFSGDVSASETIDFRSAAPADLKRTLAVKFENGRLASAESKTIPAPLNSDLPQNIPLERIQIGEDTFITLRLFSLDSKSLELRFKFELPTSSDGHRIIYYARFQYTAE